MVTAGGLPNKRLHLTGFSLPLIVNLDGLAVVSRQVNRGVMPLPMNKHLCFIGVVIFIVAQGCSLPERSQTLLASQQSKTSGATA